MQQERKIHCPECELGPELSVELSRRHFLRAAGVAALGATTSLLGSSVPTVRAARAARPAEELIKELYAGMTSEQKSELVLPYDHGTKDGKGLATRLGMYNAPIQKKTIGQHYKPAQQELVERILKAISAGDEGYRCMSRDGTFDGSGSLQGCGALLFGEPVDGQKWSWVFSGHHLTVRCDGRLDDGVGFGGPLYYGHSPNGYSDRNVFFYQTKSVMSVYDALDEKQRKSAVVVGNPGEHADSIKFRKPSEPMPGLAISELKKDQRELVEKVMHSLLSPYRKEDGDEVMAILKASGGLDKIHLAFYQQKEMNDNQRWHFWRLEGPGFVWNFRVLPHVHTYVNIAKA